MAHEWKVGDRFTLEIEVIEVDCKDRNTPILATAVGTNESAWFSKDEILHAKLIKPAVPEPRIPEIKVGQKWVTRGGETVTIISDDGTCTYPFRYKTRFGGTRLVTRGGWHSGPERPDEDDLMQIVEAPEPQKLDTSKPMRLLGSDEASFTFLQRAINGMLIIKWDSGSLDVIDESEVENIPEPKIKGRREALLGPDGELYWVSSWPGNHPLEILGRVWVEITEGDGMEAEA